MYLLRGNTCSGWFYSPASAVLSVVPLCFYEGVNPVLLSVSGGLLLAKRLASWGVTDTDAGVLTPSPASPRDSRLKAFSLCFGVVSDPVL